MLEGSRWRPRRLPPLRVTPRPPPRRRWRRYLWSRRRRCRKRASPGRLGRARVRHPGHLLAGYFRRGRLGGGGERRRRERRRGTGRDAPRRPGWRGWRRPRGASRKRRNRRDRKGASVPSPRAQIAPVPNIGIACPSVRCRCRQGIWAGHTRARKRRGWHRYHQREQPCAAPPPSSSRPPYSAAPPPPAVPPARTPHAVRTAAWLGIAKPSPAGPDRPGAL
mmetsp:Transcript_13952/g.45729  ORF Transcript_13952/g.45729 Transcript_13952/m.45729 type:complete len:221 (-) Transcript_13952:1319-1981(-)